MQTKKLRTTLGLSDNSLVRVKKEKGRLVVEPVRTFPYSVRSYTEEDIKQFIELDKKHLLILQKVVKQFKIVSPGELIATLR